MKHIVILTFAVAAALCIAISHGASSVYGFKGFHDKLLHREYVIQDSFWWRGITRDFKYPPLGYLNSKIISAIYVTDQTRGRNTSTGYASLSDGGPGFTFAHLHLKAPRGCSLNFTIDLYSPY